MTDLIALLGKLVAHDGTILVPGVDDMVNAADNEERYGVVNPSFNRLMFSPTGHFTTVSTTPLLTSTIPLVHPSPCRMTRSKSSWAE